MTSKREFYRFEKPIAADYETPSGVSCVQVYTPDDLDHLPLLQGMLATLTKPEFWDGSEADRVQRAYLWEVAWAATDWSGCVTPSEAGQQGRVTLWHRWTNVTTGNALQINVDATQLWGHYCRQNTAAVGDDNYQAVYLPAGDYEIRVLYMRLTNNGNLTVTFQHKPDDAQTTALSAVNLYGTTLANQVVTGSFTLTDNGLYHVYFQCPSKNASSSGFALPLTVTEIWKTGD